MFSFNDLKETGGAGPLTKRTFVDPVKTTRGAVYERRAIEKHLKI